MKHSKLRPTGLPATSPKRSLTLFKGQLQHLLLLAALLAGLTVLVNESALTGQFLGLTTGRWLVLAIAVPILHQLYVRLIWRVELSYSFPEYSLILSVSSRALRVCGLLESVWS